MLQPKPARMTVDEFLVWEASQEEKWELVDGVPVLRAERKWPGGAEMMAGGSRRHALVAANIIAALQPRLRGGPCVALTSDMKVRTDASARYPDVTIDCGSDAVDGTSLVAPAPRIVFEVLSPSNNVFHQTRTLADYQSIDTVEQIVFLSQDGVEAQSWRRAANGWMFAEHRDIDAEISLPSVGATLTMADAYQGVRFEAGTA